ncbi:MAG: YHYH protein, partial [Gimesia chilikensis]
MRLLTLCCFATLGCAAPLFGYPPPGFGPPGFGSSNTSATNQVKVVIKGNYRYIYSNGIPDHQPGRFPNRNNPNTIRPQQYEFRVTMEPKATRNPTPVSHSPFGVASNGVVFDAATAEFWNRNRSSGWNYEAKSGKINLGLDQSNAHVQPTGSYHYHGLPTGLIQKQGKTGEVTLIGVAADGFPIYAQFGYSDANDAESAVRKMKSSYRIK